MEQGGEQSAGFCCWGAVGQGRCTCWEPVYDLLQVEEVSEAAPEVNPAGMCSSCACKPDSPERIADREGIVRWGNSTWEGIQSRAQGGRPFFCHKGMRAIIGHLHPDGRTREDHAGRFDPPFRSDGVPLRANGEPAFLCAGWAALARKNRTAEGEPK